MTVLRPSMKGQNVSSSPMPEYLLPVRKIVGIIFPLISLWNYPAHKNPVQLLSPIQLFVTPWTAAQQSSLSITNSWSLLKIMSMSWFWHHQSVMSSNHLILCCPLLLLPSIFPSIRVFSSESAFPIRWPEYWSFSFSISPFNEYSGLISFRIDWLEFLAVEGTLKGLLQHHSSKTSILWCSALFGRRQWQPTPVLLPGKVHGWRSLVGCSPWGR